MVNGHNIFTYVANISMLSLSLVFFLTIPSSTTCFRLLTIVCLSIGGVTTLFYVFNIAEVRLSREAKEYDTKYKMLTGTGELRLSAGATIMIEND